MIAHMTRRFILTSLVLALIASAVAIVAVGRQETPSRAWVAGQTVPCALPGPESCNTQTPTGYGAD